MAEYGAGFRHTHFDADVAEAAGRKVFYHTNGKVLDILPLFMEYGFDGVNPVGPRYNDAAEFVRRTEGRLMLYGAGDSCAAIPDGAPDEVRAHARQQFAALGAGGRCIFSTHDIPAHCPRENLAGRHGGGDPRLPLRLRRLRAPAGAPALVDVGDQLVERLPVELGIQHLAPGRCGGKQRAQARSARIEGILVAAAGG